MVQFKSCLLKGYCTVVNAFHWIDGTITDDKVNDMRIL